MRLFLVLVALPCLLAACGEQVPSRGSGPEPTKPPSDADVTAPGETAPDETAPDETTPDETTPEPALSEAAARVAALAGHERVGAVLSAEARGILAAPERVTLYSIQPGIWREYGYGRNTDPSPLAHALAALKAKTGVLGSLAIDDPAPRADLLESLYAGLIEQGPGAHCYDPRHALVYERGGKTVVVCICFECSYVVVLEASTTKGRYEPLQDPRGLKAALNGLLEAAGIPLAP